MPLGTYTYLAVVAALVCAAISWLGIAGWIAAVVVAASIAAHVAGNALGTRLRDATDRHLRAGRRGGRAEAPPIPTAAPAFLETRTPLGRLVPVSVAIGAACGGTAGAVALGWLTRATAAGALLGGVSSAVVGGLFGFLLASLIEIVRTSLREAIEAEERPRRAIGSGRP